jgi:uncharacterized membrane protein
MENRLAKKSLIINIIGAILVLLPLTFKWAHLFVDSVEAAKNAATLLLVFAGLFYIGEFLLIIGLIMGLISLKNKSRLVSCISIAIDVIMTVIWVIFLNSINEMIG